jgi:hypothetical protein
LKRLEVERKHKAFEFGHQTGESFFGSLDKVAHPSDEDQLPELVHFAEDLQEDSAESVAGKALGVPDELGAVEEEKENEVEAVGDGEGRGDVFCLRGESQVGQNAFEFFPEINEKLVCKVVPVEIGPLLFVVFEDNKKSKGTEKFVFRGNKEFKNGGRKAIRCPNDCLEHFLGLVRPPVQTVQERH